MSRHPDMDRIDGVIARRDAVAAERVVELDGMTAILNPSLPAYWDLNSLELRRPGIPLEEILAAADETIGGAGLEHRTVLTLDGDDGERLFAALGPRGWDVERNFYMALHREPDRAADPGIRVEEVPLSDLVESRREFLRLALADAFDEVTDEILDQFVAGDRLYGEICGDRWFVVREEGRVVSFCRLLASDGTGQVEDVATLPDARGRGYARATILAAIEASHAAGHDLVFIGALADDWPRRLYAKLGFEVVGPETVLYRKPG